MRLAQIKKELHRMDPKLDEKDDAFAAALFLMCALNVGPNVDKLLKFTKLPLWQVAQFNEQCHKSGIFVADTKSEKPRLKISCGWADKKSGGAAFWMDVCVLLGLMERSR